MVNRSVTWADWDEDALALELQDLQEADFDLGLTGFEDAELARILNAQDATDGLTDEDAVPELPEVPISQTGDLRILGNHKLLVGDATDQACVERLMAESLQHPGWTERGGNRWVSSRERGSNLPQPPLRTKMNRYMPGAIKRRLKNLEHAVELEQAALMQQLQHEVFEAMHIPDSEKGLLDAINERGEACTPEEEAALERFSAEYERAYALVSSRQQAFEHRRVTFRY